MTASHASVEGMSEKRERYPTKTDARTSGEPCVHEGPDGLEVKALQVGEVARLGRLDELKAWLHRRRERAAPTHAELGERRLEVRTLGRKDPPAAEVRDCDAEKVLGASEVFQAVERVEPLHDLDHFVVIVGARDGEDVDEMLAAPLRIWLLTTAFTTITAPRGED